MKITYFVQKGSISESLPILNEKSKSQRQLMNSKLKKKASKGMPLLDSLTTLGNKPQQPLPMTLVLLTHDEILYKQQEMEKVESKYHLIINI